MAIPTALLSVKAKNGYNVSLHEVTGLGKHAYRLSGVDYKDYEVVVHRPMEEIKGELEQIKDRMFSDGLDAVLKDLAKATMPEYAQFVDDKDEGEVLVLELEHQINIGTFVPSLPENYDFVAEM